MPPPSPGKLSIVRVFDGRRRLRINGIIGLPSAGGGRIPTPLSLRWFHRPPYMLNLEIIDLEADGLRSWRVS